MGEDYAGVLRAAEEYNEGCYICQRLAAGDEVIEIGDEIYQMCVDHTAQLFATNNPFWGMVGRGD